MQLFTYCRGLAPINPALTDRVKWQTDFSSLWTDFFFLSEWLVGLIESADRPKSLQPFMFFFPASRREGLRLVMLNNANVLMASFNIYFSPFSGMTVNIFSRLIVELKEKCRRRRKWVVLALTNLCSRQPLHNRDVFCYTYRCSFLPLWAIVQKDEVAASGTNFEFHEKVK